MFRAGTGSAGALGVSLTAAVLAVSLGGCRMAAQGYNVEGVRLYQQGRYDAALHEFQQAVAADPENADAYYNMAATLHRLGAARNDRALLDQAENLYNQCLDLDEDHPECYRGLAVLLADTGREDRAFKLLKNWALRRPKSADARIELARLYEETGDRETAELHLQEALRIDRHNSRAWAALAHLREQAGDYEQALANYERSFRLNNFQPQVAARIASLSGTLAGSRGAPTGPGQTRTVDRGPGWTARY